MNAFVSVIGEDKKGIIKEITTILSDEGVNILDINQTIVQSYFTMVMLVDITDLTIGISGLNKKFLELGQKINLEIKVQHENIFKAMYTI